LESGTPIEGQALEAGGHRLILRLGEPLPGADILHLQGIADRAQVPNTVSAARIEIEPPLWPASRDGLAFLWESGDSPNLLFDPDLGADTAVNLTAKDTARFDSNFRMQPAGGRFEIPQSASNRVCLECKRTYEMTIELVLTPESPLSRRGVILTSASKSRRNFTLEQQAAGLYFGLRMKSRGDEAFPRVFVTDLPLAQQSHVVVTYSPGELKAYLDGELISTDTSISGGFFHWRAAPLVFGSDWNGKKTWNGRLEGVAIYARALNAEEVQESFSRYEYKLESRLQIPSWTVVATLDVCSPEPTLKEIDPYREALVTCRYRVDEIVAGSDLGTEFQAARWAIMDGQYLDQHSPGAAANLRLTLLADNPQLASVYLSDTLEPPAAGPLFYLQTP
jgi:hypothetical protein